MSDIKPIIVWFRRDLRLRDHEALSAAVKLSQPIIPLWIHDETVEILGAAPKWRLGLSVKYFSDRLKILNSKLILRRGSALEAIQDVIDETGAQKVFWSRMYDPQAIERDTKVKAALLDQKIEVRSYKGHLLFEPWNVETKAGGFFKVYTPFWKTVRNFPVSEPIVAPASLNAPNSWPASDVIDDWDMDRNMYRGASVVKRFVGVGEEVAENRLATFIHKDLQNYKENRDFPSLNATSKLSENLTYGEISPRIIYNVARAAMERGMVGAEHFLKELVWREFAYHLVFHTPHIASENWRPEWNRFSWRPDNEDAELWRRGITGEPFVDAGMRELYVTGTMHNRVRMIVGSYLTKHLITNWKVGMNWFADTLIDWDPAANAMGWQWVAGCGPDAVPYFRVFNPETQAEKFDQNSEYRSRFIAPAEQEIHEDTIAFYNAIPNHWKASLMESYPRKIISLKRGRERALAAYSNMRV